MLSLCNVMNIENVSRFVQLNADYCSRQEEGSLKFGFVIVIGSALHGRYRDEWLLFIGNVTSSLRGLNKTTSPFFPQ